MSGFFIKINYRCSLLMVILIKLCISHVKKMNFWYTLLHGWTWKHDAEWNKPYVFIYVRCQNEQIYGDRVEIVVARGCRGREAKMKKLVLMDMKFWGVMKCSRIRLWWWLWNTENILKTTEPHTSIEWIIGYVN